MPMWAFFAHSASKVEGNSTVTQVNQLPLLLASIITLN